jgi:glycosyltransferase involved in cell wall biosynthesis
LKNNKYGITIRPLITIITVVFNGEEHLENTIISVIAQNYQNLEYIIIDGGSTDGTLDIIKRYEERIDLWVSEKDYGIYDAMNKGVSFSNGKYIQFLNSGDLFSSSSALVDACKFLLEPYKIFIFDYDMNGKIYSFNPNFISLLKGTPCHQALMYESSFLINNPFSIDFKISSDYYNFLEAFFLFQVKNIRQPLVIYDLNGLSSALSAKKTIRYERLKIVLISKIPLFWKVPMVLYNLIRLIK